MTNRMPTAWTAARRTYSNCVDREVAAGAPVCHGFPLSHDHLETHQLVSPVYLLQRGKLAHLQRVDDLLQEESHFFERIYVRRELSSPRLGKPPPITGARLCRVDEFLSCFVEEPRTLL